MAGEPIEVEPTGEEEVPTEEKPELPTDAGQVLDHLVKQGAWDAARKYIDFLEAKAQPVQRPPGWKPPE